MELGTFSVSLAVKDIEASISFYEKMGFKIIDGGHLNKAFPDSEKHKWRIMQHPSAIIGLFQGMFEENILTFNPTDARAIQKQLKQQKVELIQEADETTKGPTSLTLKDPDGNTILIDQHNE